MVFNASKDACQSGAKVDKKCCVAVKWKGSIVLDLESIAKGPYTYRVWGNDFNTIIMQWYCLTKIYECLIRLALELFVHFE